MLQEGHRLLIQKAHRRPIPLSLTPLLQLYNETGSGMQIPSPWDLFVMIVRERVLCRLRWTLGGEGRHPGAFNLNRICCKTLGERARPADPTLDRRPG